MELIDVLQVQIVNDFFFSFVCSCILQYLHLDRRTPMHPQVLLIETRPDGYGFNGYGYGFSHGYQNGYLYPYP
jgi:hypothetical protein